MALTAVALITAACTHVPATNASLSLEVADRLTTVGDGQGWYTALKLVGSRPDVAWAGPGELDAEVTLAAGIDPGSSIASRACMAILDAVNNPKYGPPFGIGEIDLLGEKYSHECREPEASGSPGQST